MRADSRPDRIGPDARTPIDQVFRGELSDQSQHTALTRADVDLLHRRVIVTKQRQELSKAGITIRPPKTEAGVRAPESPKLVAPEIEAHLEMWVGESPDAPLIPGPKGGLRRSTVYEAWHKALAAAGLPDDLKPHDLRHLSNTLAAQVPGVTVKDLMARMGHKSEQAALRYLHASAEADATMAQGMDAAIRRAREPRNDDRDGASNDDTRVGWRRTARHRCGCWINVGCQARRWALSPPASARTWSFPWSG